MCTDHNHSNPDLFTRDGTRWSAHRSATLVETGRPRRPYQVRFFDPCGRCGGTGKVWATWVEGGVCFACRGYKGRMATSPLYTQAELDKLDVAKARKAEAKRKKQLDQARFVMDQLQQDIPELAAAMAKADLIINADDHLEMRSYESMLATLRDLVSKATQYGLNEKQGHYVVSLVDQMTKLDAKVRAEKLTEEALRVNPTAWVEDGRQTIEGEVLALREDDGVYGYSIKMLLRDEQGRKFWGTVPRALENDVARGSRVRLVGTVSRSDDDPIFGKFKRPAKAEILATATTHQELEKAAV
jgi:hypothetical protein